MGRTGLWRAAESDLRGTRIWWGCPKQDAHALEPQYPTGGGLFTGLLGGEGCRDARGPESAQAQEGHHMKQRTILGVQQSPAHASSGSAVGSVVWRLCRLWDPPGVCCKLQETRSLWGDLAGTSQATGEGKGLTSSQRYLFHGGPLTKGMSPD